MGVLGDLSIEIAQEGEAKERSNYRDSKEMRSGFRILCRGDRFCRSSCQVACPSLDRSPI